MTFESTISNAHERSDRAEQTRGAILAAAIREFSAHGLSGARTEAIAEAAKANKALLFYYFKSKEGLYAAAIEEVSAQVVAEALTALDPEFSPGERLLRSALNHFDRVLTRREFQSLLQQEMVRFRQGQKQPGNDGSTSEHAAPIFFRSAFEPLFEKLRGAVDDGIHSGEICPVDTLQVLYSIFGANVFYFLSAPMIQRALSFHPFDHEALKVRREAAVVFLGNALFMDRAHGLRVATRVLEAMPMPQIEKFHEFQQRSTTS